MKGDSTLSIRRRTALRALAGMAAVGGSAAVVGAGRDSRPVERDDEEALDELPLDDDAQNDDGAEVPPACDFGAIVEDVMDSVVTVRVFDQHDREFVQGSGWVYDRDGDVVDVATNWHVVFAAIGADVRFGRDDWRPVAQLLGADQYSDLAVLRIEDAPAYAEPLSITDEYPNQGDPVAALGAPIGLEGSITTGIVSAVDRSTTVAFEYFMYNVPSTIQIDAATNPGNSGGPLVDCGGDVVGVNFAGTPPVLAENINFAVSTTMIERIVPELVDTGSFEHPYLGMHGMTLSPMMSRLNGVDETMSGVYVELTVDGFPADVFLEGTASVDRETGIPIGGDVILAADGTDVASADALRNYLFAETRPEETIELTILRHGDEREIPVTLDARPDELESIAVQESTM